MSIRTTVENVPLSRGIIRSNKPLPGCVTLDICLREKNVNCKLYGDKIHICGIKELAQASECVNYLLSYVDAINSDLVYAREHRSEYERALAWIDTNVKGEPIWRSCWDNCIRIPDAANLPPDLSRILILLLTRIYDYYYYSDFRDELCHFIEIDSVGCVKGIENVQDLMVRSSINLGTALNIPMIVDYMQRETDYGVSYDNMVRPAEATIHVPTEDDGNHTKAAFSTFRIYRTGNVTIWSHSLKAHEKACASFMERLQLASACGCAY